MRPERTARCGTRLHSDWNRFVAESHQVLDDCGLVPESEEDLAEIEPDLTHRRGEDRIVQSTARRGQAFFPLGSLECL